MSIESLLVASFILRKHVLKSYSKGCRVYAYILLKRCGFTNSEIVLIELFPRIFEQLIHVLKEHIFHLLSHLVLSDQQAAVGKGIPDMPFCLNSSRRPRLVPHNP